MDYTEVVKSATPQTPAKGLMRSIERHQPSRKRIGNKRPGSKADEVKIRSPDSTGDSRRATRPRDRSPVHAAVPVTVPQSPGW